MFSRSKVPFWQFFNFSKMALLNQCIKFENCFGQKHSSETIWKWVCRIQDLCRKGDFLKKSSQELFFLFFFFRFLWIPQKPGTLNQRRPFFLSFKNLYKVKGPCNWNNLTHTLSNSLHNYPNLCITSTLIKIL